MKRIFIFSVIILFTGMAAYAQDKNTTFGVKLGGNLSTIEGRDVDFSIVKPKLGFQLGGTMDIAFTNHLYLLSGLEITQKGYKMQDGDTTTYRAMYLQLPIHIGYKLKFDVIDIVFRGGPYLTYGFAGKSKSDNPTRDGVKFFGQNGAKKVDFGLGVALGTEFGKGKYGIYLGYDWGFIKLYERDEDIYNGNAYLTVGYKF